VYFNASSSFDPDGQIVSYEWNFGVPQNQSFVTTETSFFFNYLDAGPYTISLSVTDDTGQKVSSSQTIILPNTSIQSTTNNTINPVVIDSGLPLFAYIINQLTGEYLTFFYNSDQTNVQISMQANGSTLNTTNNDMTGSPYIRLFHVFTPNTGYLIGANQVSLYLSSTNITTFTSANITTFNDTLNLVPYDAKSWVFSRYPNGFYQISDPDTGDILGLSSDLSDLELASNSSSIISPQQLWIISPILNLNLKWIPSF